MVVRKIKFWARIGQIMFFVVNFAYAEFENTQPQIEQMKYNFTPYSSVVIIIAFLAFILLTEAIVRLIGYFAELIARKKR